MGYKVAVVGLNGQLGKPVLEALISEPFVSKLNTPILALTSSGKEPVSSDKIKYVNTTTTPFKEAFKGVDAVVNLTNVPFGPHEEILEAVIANKVKLYIPSQFGTYLPAAQKLFPEFLTIKVAHSAKARAAGIKTVDIYSSIFTDSEQKYFGHDFPFLDFDEASKTVEVLGSEDAKINPVFLSDVGKSVASVVTKPDYSKIPDSIRVFSAHATIHDVITFYENKHGVKLNRNVTDPKKLLADAKEKSKNFEFKDILLYLKAILAQGEGHGVIYERENEREYVNPGESLFKWTEFRTK